MNTPRTPYLPEPHPTPRAERIVQHCITAVLASGLVGSLVALLVTG